MTSDKIKEIYQKFGTGRLDGFEAAMHAVIAAHLEELTGVEIPEPVGQIYGFNHGYRPLTAWNDTRDFVIGTKLVTLDQCRETVAAAVARKDAEHQQENALLDEIGNLLEPVDYKGSYAEGIKALAAERDRLREALQGMMNWQVKNVRIWNNSAYDRAAAALGFAI